MPQPKEITSAQMDVAVAEAKAHGMPHVALFLGHMRKMIAEYETARESRPDEPDDDSSSPFEE